jgi:hypothetical protein
MGRYRTAIAFPIPRDAPVMKTVLDFHDIIKRNGYKLQSSSKQELETKKGLDILTILDVFKYSAFKNSHALHSFTLSFQQRPSRLSFAINNR